MAFMVLALSCLPCKDGAKAGSAKATVEMKKVADKSHSEPDDCPPFCICSCCGTHTANTAFFSIQHLALKYRSENSLYPPSPIYNISLPVWQPPQLVG